MTRFATARLPVAVVATAAGLLVGLLTGQVEAALLTAPWTVVLALGVARTRRPDTGIRNEIDADRVIVGDHVELRTTLTGADGIVRLEPVVGAGRTVVAGGARVAAASGDATTFDWSVAVNRWGPYELGRARIAITEPYGLFQWRGVRSDPAVVRVHPAPDDATMLRPRRVRHITGSHTSALVDRGTEYADIRQFAPGDALRDINWRASARTDDLWVSERHADRAADVVILIDSFIEHGADIDAQLDIAVTAALGLADAHLVLTDRVGFVELGGIIRWVGIGSGRYQRLRLVDAILSTAPFGNAARKDLDMVPVRGLPPRSMILAISPMVDDRFVGSLLQLAGRGHDIAVIETPPPGVHDGPDTPTARVALRIWEAERAKVRADLAARGVAVTQWLDDATLIEAIATLGRARRRMMVSRR